MTMLLSYNNFNKKKENTMKTKRKAKWENKLTLTEVKHLREITDGTLRSVKKCFSWQKEIRDEKPNFGEPCWDCRIIAQKLNEPV